MPRNFTKQITHVFEDRQVCTRGCVHGAVVFVVKMVGSLKFPSKQLLKIDKTLSSAHLYLVILLLDLHQHNYRPSSLVYHCISPDSSSNVLNELLNNFRDWCSLRQETNIPIHYSACQQLLLQRSGRSRCEMLTRTKINI